ncbi:Retrovirus-related Pol polyprotein from transposon [Trichinella patagoniensis]|uniref:Retrovirus-related Pol polyprotein from transposon n=1 Tax=Trichinella patagoniensis TaxID=990121 RepID=A0A0V0Z5T9_9BILA|nr:Retrovirus-related Pol polyprotein from transposon [Trichinella patagoniensis]
MSQLGKLQPVPLPLFDGNILEFKSFWDQIKMSVDEVTTVPSPSFFICGHVFPAQLKESRSARKITLRSFRRSTVGRITSIVRGGGESRVKGGGRFTSSRRFDIPFIIDTDASETGIGAVLSQKHDPEGERVIAYASRTLSKTERLCWTTRKELLSIRFTLRTDHDSLTWLRNFKEPEGQVARWLEHLQEYDTKVVHRRGRQHNNADAMSRGPEVTEDNEDHATTEMPSAAVGTAAVSSASNEGAEPLDEPQDENIESVIRFLRRGRRLTDSE